MAFKVLSPYSQRLLRVSALFVFTVFLLTLVRLEYLIWNWPQFHAQGAGRILKSFLIGARFDAAAAAWLSLPLLLVSLVPWPAAWEKAWRIAVFALFLLIQIPFLTLNLIDVEFVNFVGRRMTADVLFILTEAQGKAGGFLASYGLLMGIAALTLLFAGFGAYHLLFRDLRWHGGRPRPSWCPEGRLARGVLAFLCVLGFIIASRGGLQKKPISFVDAQVFDTPALNNLVSNTSFVLLKNLNQENLPKQRFFENRAAMEAYLNGAVRGKSLLEGRRAPAPQNVVILILESFGLEYMGEVNGVKGYSPFLDSLARRGLFFRNGFANGRRSIEGIPAVLSGIPALMNEPFVSSPFASNRVEGLGSLLKERGYSTHFFHGGQNGTMHFDSYTRSAGIDHYYGAREYPDPADDDGVWGIYDGPFLRWMEKRIGALERPFFVSFFSISSHNPYLIPDNVRSRYPEGPLPILKTIAYTDESLRDFFAAAEKTGWYENTLFVITADHTFRPYESRFDNELSRFRVPILFFHPAYEWPKGIDRDQIVQQIDILPSVMDFLGQVLPAENLLARSVFVPGEKSAALFVDGTYFLVEKNEFLHWPRGGEPRFYALGDAGQSRPLGGAESPRAQELLLRLKAAIQYFSEAMWENRLAVPAPSGGGK
ncbi:MAG: sulfatase-like hydrolase/transferase [Bdellovibrionaceae bacterium]|nr:sulfatase-like hydrolase/transferase [Pseudobdellovibrionaceae bacterium]